MKDKPIPKENIKKILVRGPDWVGDFVVATPVYRELRKNFPSARISAVVRAWTRGFLSNCPYIDEIVEYDSRDSSPKNFLSIISKIKKEKYDLAVLLSGNYNAALIPWLCGIKYRAGYDYDKRGYLLTHSLKETGREYRLERAVRVIEYIGLKIEDKKPELWVSEQDEKDASQLMEPIVKRIPLIGSKSKIIGMGIGTTEQERCWPIEQYIDLIDSFIDEIDSKVVLFGSNLDIQRGEEIISQVKNKSKVTNLINRTTLNQFTSCMKYLNLYVTSDTGGLHIAYTMDTPTLVIIGPTDPVEVLPKKDNLKYIWKQLECSPCTMKEYHSCPTLECLRDITVEEVKTAGYALLSVK